MKVWTIFLGLIGTFSSCCFAARSIRLSGEVAGSVCLGTLRRANVRQCYLKVLVRFEEPTVRIRNGQLTYTLAAHSVSARRSWFCIVNRAAYQVISGKLTG
ncbi:uncharacterized protein LOC108087408 [Drosophila ficusphila]|uniref:uncharacterized protein LOC108087408 n=1 Tax=Drosophila ficusphila TaxID=30025 RepID=UPI001C89CE6B|nr:uncharacterized protein LOC108087408 [Drosophila ficusphila]